MKKLTLLLLSLSFSSIMLAGTYSGGSGTSAAPYKIATTNDLIELSNTSGDWGAYFNQTADEISTYCINDNKKGGLL